MTFNTVSIANECTNPVCLCRNANDLNIASDPRVSAGRAQPLSALLNVLLLLPWSWDFEHGT